MYFLTALVIWLDAPLVCLNKDVRLARIYQGGGTRFVEDNLAGDPEAGEATARVRPPSRTVCAAQAAADLVGAGAELAAVQAFRSLNRVPERAPRGAQPHPP